MQQQKQKIAIIGGAGNVGTALVQRLTATGHNPDDITIIGQHSTNFGQVLPYGVRTSCNYERAFDSKIIMLTVKPKETVIEKVFTELAKQQGRAYFDHTDLSYKPDHILVPVVSCLQMHQITHHSYFRRYFVNCMLNTNVAYGTGLIALASPSQWAFDVIADLFADMGTVLRVPQQKMQLLVTFIGAINAINARVCWDAAEGDSTAFVELLKATQKAFLSRNDEFPEKVQAYLTNLRFLYKKHLGKDYELYADKALKSTVDTLLLRGMCTEDDIKKFIKEVATKGGCTEKGVYDVTPATYSDMAQLDSIIRSIRVATNGFNDQIIAGLSKVEISHKRKKQSSDKDYFTKGGYMFS